MLLVATGLAAWGVTAPIAEPVKAREAEASIYDTAHTLKMAEDEYQKHDPEANLYGTAHTLKTAQDEYKKRDAEVSEREANLTEPLTL